jgi:hypothetical protein
VDHRVKAGDNGLGCAVDAPGIDGHAGWPINVIASAAKQSILSLLFPDGLLRRKRSAQ